MTRQVAVLSVGRSDFGRYLPVLRALKNDPRIELRLIASGGHFFSRFGNTIREVEEAGFDWEPGIAAAANRGSGSSSSSSSSSLNVGFSISE